MGLRTPNNVDGSMPNNSESDTQAGKDLNAARRSLRCFRTLAT
jgi:hypothetical protein